MIVISGSRKILQDVQDVQDVQNVEEEEEQINFQPNERTEEENELGDWINCNTIPVDHPEKVVFFCWRL